MWWWLLIVVRGGRSLSETPSKLAARFDVPLAPAFTQAMNAGNGAAEALNVVVFAAVRFACNALAARSGGVAADGAADDAGGGAGDARASALATRAFLVMLIVTEVCVCRSTTNDVLGLLWGFGSFVALSRREWVCDNPLCADLTAETERTNVARSASSFRREAPASETDRTSPLQSSRRELHSATDCTSRAGSTYSWRESPRSAAVRRAAVLLAPPRRGRLS